MPQPGPGDSAEASEKQDTDSIIFDAFSGLRNTIALERLGPRELSRAQNIDLDDAGQVRRRRGFRKALDGAFHSLYRTADGILFVVANGVLCRLQPDYSLVPLLSGIGPSPIAYVDIGSVLYFTSATNSAQVDLTTFAVSPWCAGVDPSYQPGLAPAGVDWWWSPVANPDTTLAPVAGKLLGPPPLGTHLAWFNGRIYLSAGPMLWGTELFVYDYVDKNKGYRYFEDVITGLCAVEDGIYVGTRSALYFIQGQYGEETRVLKEPNGVIAGSMIAAPGEIISPEGRRRPDIPQPTQKGMTCMTTAGIVIGLGSGTTYNMTRTNFIFPDSERAASMFRYQDGMHTIVTTLSSGGTPRSSARIGDHVSVDIIRAIDRKGTI